METEYQTPFYKQIWFLGGVAALAVFALCFFAIDYVSQPDEPKAPEVENKVIASVHTNEPLIIIARQQGWIEADATEMTSVDAAEVDSLGEAFVGSDIQSLKELQYFVALKELKSGAFAHADELKDIVIPSSVEAIEDGVLAYCPALESIAVDSANTHYDSRGGCNGIVCTWKGKLMLVAGCKNTVLSKDMVYIAPQAFKGCTALKEFAFPERMESLGAEAFMDCASLRVIDIPKNIRFVEESTFKGCKALTVVTLPKSIERLRQDSFKGCFSLEKIVCPRHYVPIIENAFDSFNATVYVPEGQENKYFRDKEWKRFKDVKELR